VSSELIGAAVPQQCCHCKNKAACLLAAMLDDGYLRFVGYMPTHSIIAVRNDDRIIDICLTTLADSAQSLFVYCSCWFTDLL